MTRGKSYRSSTCKHTYRHTHARTIRGNHSQKIQHDLQKIHDLYIVSENLQSTDFIIVYLINHNIENVQNVHITNLTSTIKKTDILPFYLSLQTRDCSKR